MRRYCGQQPLPIASGDIASRNNHHRTRNDPLSKQIM